MFYLNPNALYIVARLQHEDRLRQAELAQLAQAALAGQPNLFIRVIQRLSIFNRPTKTRTGAASGLAISK